MKINLFVTIREAKEKFKKKINSKKFDWVEAAAEDGYTNKKNFDDLKSIKLMPLMLKKPGKISLKKKFLSTHINSPIICCPMGHQTQFDKDGEIETAKGVYAAGGIAFWNPEQNISQRYKNKNQNAKIGWLIFLLEINNG